MHETKKVWYKVEAKAFWQAQDDGLACIWIKTEYIVSLSSSTNSIL